MERERSRCERRKELRETRLATSESGGRATGTRGGSGSSGSLLFFHSLPDFSQSVAAVDSTGNSLAVQVLKEEVLVGS